MDPPAIFSLASDQLLSGTASRVLEASLAALLVSHLSEHVPSQERQ